MSVRTDVVNLIVNVGGDKAKDELNQLRKKSADLNSELKNLKKGTAEYIEKNKELADVRKQIDGVKSSLGLAVMSQKELIAELNKLKAIKGSLTPQTKEFFELEKQIKATERRLYDVKNGVFGFKSALSKVGAEVKQFGLLAAGYLGFEFVTSAFKNIIAQSGKVSDQLADVRRVTGQSQVEVESLLATFRNFDTRTATSQLLDYAKIAGKLGIASKDIASFVQATDMLVTSLGDELGDADAISENIGKIINIYDKGAAITGERTLQIGNAIVDLANKGVASGNFIVDFTKRLAGIANTANVSLEASIGLAAGLEELGQTSETSSTAVTQLITKIGTDVPKYAALAGKSVAEFGATLKASPVEALIQLAEGLTKNKQGFAEIAVAFKDAEANGVRVTSTLGVLGQKAEFLRSKIATAGEALTNTTQITQAYDLKNQTLGATIDKIGKKLASVFTSSAFMSGIKSAIEGFAKLIGAVGSTNDSLSKFREQSKKVAGLEKDIAPLIAHYELLKNKTTLGVKEQGFMADIISKVAQAIPYAVTEFDKYGKAIDINTSKAKEYIKMQQLILKEKNRQALRDKKEELKVQEEILKANQMALVVIQKQMPQALSREKGYTSSNPLDMLSAAFTRSSDALNKDLEKYQKSIAETHDRISGLKGLISELDGSDMAKPSETPLNSATSLDTSIGAASITGSSSATKEKTKADTKNYYQELLDLLHKFQSEYAQSQMSADEAEHHRIVEKYKKAIAEAKKHAPKLVEEFEQVRTKELNAFAAEHSIDALSLHADAELNTVLQLGAEVSSAIDNLVNSSQENVKKKIEELEAKTQAFKDAINASVNLAFNGLNEIESLADRQDQQRLDNELRRNDIRRENYDRLLKNKQISQARYDKAMADIDAQEDKRKRQYARKQAERDQALGIVNAIFSTAQGVARAFKDYAWPYSLIPAGIIAGLGAVQIASIANQELPEAERGMIIPGRRHSEGGTTIVDKHSGAPLVEAEVGEVILSRNTVANNPEVINALLHSSMNENGRRVGFNWSNPTLTSQSALPRMEQGGPITSQSITKADIDRLILAFSTNANNTNDVSTQPSIRAHVVLKDVQQASSLYNDLRRNSGLNQ